MAGNRLDGSPLSLTPEAAVPLHRQLFLVLSDEIARGALSAGDPLPTEQGLCEQFGVSRITVRRALADLVQQGLVTRRQGVGSFVRRQISTAPRANTRSYLDELRQTQFETQAEVIEFGLRATPQTIAEKLGVVGEALHIVRLRRERRTGEPLLVTEAWLPAGLDGVITAEELRRTPLYRLLAAAGFSLGHIQHEITAEIAGPRQAQLLDTAIGAALLRVNQLVFSPGDHIHHLLSILLSPRRSRILINQSGEELPPGVTMAISHDVTPAPA
jgi:GntR family transcriptional regulator